MKMENRYFEVTPKIVRANSVSTIKIKPLYSHCSFKQDAVYELSYYPLERFSNTGEYKYQNKINVKPVDGCIYIRQFFKGEQEHSLKLMELVDGKEKRSFDFRVYSLEEDLFKRKPYKGDLHMHTCYSDGIESPGFVAAYCRRVGLDFMAITDHRLYAPSVEAQKDFESADIDLLICRGEEVHPPKNPVHMINFGGNFSINEMFKVQEERYIKEVKDIEGTIKGIEDPDARYQCASCIWCFDRIREGGGLGILCHPYWKINEGYYISDTVISYMYEHQPYDANEIIGGYYKWQEESNTLQTARLNEERAKGRKVPIVGVSDAHGCEGKGLFGWFYTITFAAENKQTEIINSIKDLYSVAVEAIPGESVRTFGPFRLVKYSQFLIREVLPTHDELCFEEGQLMLKYLSGDKNAEDILKILKGQTSGLYSKLWDI